jgi:para-aminobenzoate synthetase component 1
MLSWSNQFNICCFLDNHNYISPFHSYECVAAAGTLHVFKPGADFFSSLSSFVKMNDDWIFGHFNYDIKNQIEPGLTSGNPDHTDFPDSFLFVPKVVLQLVQNELTIGVIDNDPNEIFQQLIIERVPEDKPPSLKLKPRMSREEYLENISVLKEHIKHGDCYEINYCQEFYTKANINPISSYRRLSNISPNPFSVCYKLEQKYLLSASPERYIKRKGQKIISQPIKGTSARNITDAETDSKLKQQLFRSPKDRSENVMVVDLVRNDLSKVCNEGSVGVEELFQVYTFPTVHQMISTITGSLKNNIDFADILKATFPMGSMTGAPKIKVMELIEKYEKSKRGVYSGAVGYISPDKDFDFNVVIRSLVYNSRTSYLSYHTGSAVTSYSDPQQEYEECILKGKAIVDMFSGTQPK